MNILILSSGSRNKIVQYFKENFEGGKVIATDNSFLAPSLYEADKCYVVDKITSEKYLDQILDICRKEDISCLLSLIDPELSLLAKNQDKFLAIGSLPLVSDYDTIELCFDKYKMALFLSENGIPTVKTYNSFDSFEEAYKKAEVSFPVFIKPVRGSASINISKIECINHLKEVINSSSDELIIQEFMAGAEYGVDAYIEPESGEISDIFIKKKIKMRAGETDKSVSQKNMLIFNLVKKLVQVLKFKFVIDIDVFERDGQYYVSEVNPRFGGGYPHAYESGVNFPLRILNTLNGVSGEPVKNLVYDETYMMKYSDLIVKNVNR